MTEKKSRPKAELKLISIEQLQRGKYQPRKEFDSEALQELADSLQSNGLLQPIIVRPLNEHNYEIIAGERRWRAAQLAGWSEINCLINRFSDEQAAEAAAIENIIRVDLNPIEEANAYQRLIEEFGYIHDEVAIAVGKSRVKITNTLRLLKLDPSVQKLIIENQLSEGHGKTLAALSLSLQRELAQKCLAYHWNVRKLELEVKKLSQAPAADTLIKKDPNLAYLEKIVTDKIGCRTSIDFDVNRGSLKIEFANLDILDGLLKKLKIDINQLDQPE
ncbi:MAG: ParB/RepB/Spo0J family partition protein [Pseudomonadota bacterium]